MIGEPLGRGPLKVFASGQGLVEFVVTFPVLLIMLSGLMEFGFLLNEYLDVLDGAREAARFASDADPFPDACDPSPGDDDRDYGEYLYINAATLAENTMAPLRLDPNKDDIVISVFSIKNGIVRERFPKNGCLTSLIGQWRRYEQHTSRFDNALIESRLRGTAPNTGIVLVEIFFAYEQKFKLPWITVFVPDPIEVHTFTMMPLVAAEPTPTPIPTPTP